MTEAVQFRLEIVGPFALFDASGNCLRIPSKKGRALLAVLALSPRGERSRVWLQDLLWSRVERTEAQNSLRRELSNLRRALGETDPPLIEADSTMVRLRKRLMSVDADEVQWAERPDRTLLEGFDLAHEEPFEEWLRELRIAPTGKRPRSLPSGLVGDSGWEASGRPAIGIVPSVTDDGPERVSIELSITIDRFISTLMETGLVDVLDYRLEAPRPKADSSRNLGPDAFLSIGIVESGGLRFALAKVTRVADGVILLIRRKELGVERLGAEDPELAIFIRETTDQLLWILVQGADWRTRPKHLAARQAFCAIDQMFSLRSADLPMADQNLAASLALSPQSTTYAWRAYRSVFLFDDPRSVDRQDIMEIALENERKALEADPYNSLSYALLAHVRSFVLRDFETAGEYLTRAKSLGSDHVLFHDSAAMLSFYLGDLQGARLSAERSDMLGRHLPYRYSFATSLCMIDGLQGDLVRAIAHGERAIRLRPHGAQRPYSPALRYLGASYAAAGMHERALDVFEKLAAVDPMARSENIHISRYPTPSAQAARFLREGLQAVGL